MGDDTTPRAARSRSVRLTDEEFEQIEQTAAACGVSAHAFMRVVLIVASGEGALFDVVLRVVNAVNRRKDEVRGW